MKITNAQDEKSFKMIETSAAVEIECKHEKIGKTKIKPTLQKKVS